MLRESLVNSAFTMLGGGLSKLIAVAAGSQPIGSFGDVFKHAPSTLMKSLKTSGLGDNVANIILGGGPIASLQYIVNKVIEFFFGKKTKKQYA